MDNVLIYNAAKGNACKTPQGNRLHHHLTFIIDEYFCFSLHAGFGANPAAGSLFGNKPAAGGLGTGLGTSFGAGTGGIMTS